MNVHSQNYAEARDRMVELMSTVAPAEVLDIVRFIVADLANQLGESPEAWRGAVLASGFLGMLLGSVGDDEPMNKAGIVTAICVAMIADHPAARPLVGKP